MATFCPTNTTVYGLNDYQNASYAGGIVALISPTAERDSGTNLLTDNASSVVYQALSINDTKAFSDKVITEYCYFNGLYVSATESLMSIIGNASAPRSNINMYSNVTTTLIGNLIDIATVVGYIHRQRSSDPNIGPLNDNMQMALEMLQSQLGMITSTAGTNASLSANIKLYKEMERYSRQKADYTNNLLGLYSFLNITALGLLFYIYRSL
jgi:hypothetical protein